VQFEVRPVSDAGRVRESLAALTVFAIDVFVCPRCGGRSREYTPAASIFRAYSSGWHWSYYEVMGASESVLIPSRVCGHRFRSQGGTLPVIGPKRVPPSDP